MIDLIIPAYNSEDTIARALGSVVAQTKGHAIITTVVDDGSTDNTEKIVESFKKLIPIKYIKLPKNLGKPGLVRNEGLKRATFPYVMFMDADDILAPQTAEIVSRAILQYRPDLIIGGFYRDNNTDEYQYTETKNLTWLHGNVYSKRFLTKNNILFDEYFNEDGSFNLKCFYLAENKYYIEKPLYYWMNNRNSITRSDDKFMLNITKDYICTFIDAINFIVDKNNDILSNKDFKRICVQKLADFFCFLEAQVYYKVKTENVIIQKMNKYVSFLKRNNLLTKEYLYNCNYSFNTNKLFADIVKKNNIYYYLDKFNIEYSEGFN